MQLGATVLGSVELCTRLGLSLPCYKVPAGQKGLSFFGWNYKEVVKLTFLRENNTSINFSHLNGGFESWVPPFPWAQDTLVFE